MNDLIKTTTMTIGTEQAQAVNARELWEFLESKQEFSNWIKNRISEYGFSEGKDFLTNLSKSHGRPSREYIITLDMAKELAMVENNERGKQARQYFIEVEKRFRNVGSIAEAVISAMTPVIRDNERLKARLDFARHFLPSGNPGELNEDGKPKTQFRRGYYTAGNGRSITALVERMDHPGLFDEVELIGCPRIEANREA